jgi:hypothetical protein
MGELHKKNLFDWRDCSGRVVLWASFGQVVGRQELVRVSGQSLRSGLKDPQQQEA